MKLTQIDTKVIDRVWRSWRISNWDIWFIFFSCIPKTTNFTFPMFAMCYQVTHFLRPYANIISCYNILKEGLCPEMELQTNSPTQIPLIY